MEHLLWMQVFLRMQCLVIFNYWFLAKLLVLLALHRWYDYFRNALILLHFCEIKILNFKSMVGLIWRSMKFALPVSSSNRNTKFWLVRVSLTYGLVRTWQVVASGVDEKTLKREGVCAASLPTTMVSIILCIARNNDSERFWTFSCLVNFLLTEQKRGIVFYFIIVRNAASESRQ